jgi:dTDP-4-dehydrorhamnose reductase
MRIVVTGGTGKLGMYLVPALECLGWAVQGWGRVPAGGQTVPVDLMSASAIHAALDVFRPQAVIHTAAVSTVADCCKDPAQARGVNVDASAAVAQWCARDTVRFIHLSTDMVFDGEQAPYDESAAVAPVSMYGQTKADAEVAVLRACPAALIVRVALMFGPTRSHRRSFFDTARQQLQDGQVMDAFDDEWRTPLHMTDAATALCGLAVTADAGVVHLAGPERLSRYDMCCRMAAGLGLSPETLVRPVSRLSVPSTEPRQQDLSMVSTRLNGMLPTFRPGAFGTG